MATKPPHLKGSAPRPLSVVWAKILEIAALWGFLALLFPIRMSSMEPMTKWIIVGGLLAFLILGSFWIWLRPVVGAVRVRLRAAMPWLVLVLLLWSGTTLVMVWSLRTSPPAVILKGIPIPLDLGHGHIFNSWENTAHIGFIHAWGANGNLGYWDIASTNPSEASFSYNVDSSLKSSGGASSGAYQTFYDKPGDMRVFPYLFFSVSSDEKCGTGAADIGVRLATDNPTDNDKKEYFTYELTSLNSLGQHAVDGKMHQYKVPVSRLKLVHHVQTPGPLPYALDEHTINKVVFFVDNEIVRKCPSNTLRIRDVSLQAYDIDQIGNPFWH